MHPLGQNVAYRVHVRALQAHAARGEGKKISTLFPGTIAA